MDIVIVCIIVAMAVGLTVRGFVKIYKGEGSCSGCSCSCTSKNACDQKFPVLTEKQ